MCRAVGCTEKHDTHWCSKCKMEDSDHRSGSCTNSKNQFATRQKKSGYGGGGSARGGAGGARYRAPRRPVEGSDGWSTMRGKKASTAPMSAFLKQYKTQDASTWGGAAAGKSKSKSPERKRPKMAFKKPSTENRRQVFTDKFLKQIEFIGTSPPLDQLFGAYCGLLIFMVDAVSLECNVCDSDEPVPLHEILNINEITMGRILKHKSAITRLLKKKMGDEERISDRIGELRDMAEKVNMTIGTTDDADAAV
jgi:hypothetical protein